jgi:hypothetical protein
VNGLYLAEHKSNIGFNFEFIGLPFITNRECFLELLFVIGGVALQMGQVRTICRWGR